MKLSTQKSYWRRVISRKLVVLVLIRGAGMLLAVSVLFYKSFWAALILSPLLLPYMRYGEKKLIEREREKFQVQFQEAMQVIAHSLKTGYSMENAMGEVIKDLGTLYGPETVIMKEFTYMLRQLKMNVPMETVWKGFSGRVEQEDVTNYTTVFLAAQKSGGDMISILHNASVQIREKIEVKREISMVMAEKQMEFKVMSMIPFGIIVYMYVSFPDSMGLLYGNLAGITVMTVCLLLYGAAYMLGQHIMNIEV